MNVFYSKWKFILTTEKYDVKYPFSLNQKRIKWNVLNLRYNNLKGAF